MKVYVNYRTTEILPVTGAKHTLIGAGLLKDIKEPKEGL